MTEKQKCIPLVVGSLAESVEKRELLVFCWLVVRLTVSTDDKDEGDVGRNVTDL